MALMSMTVMNLRMKLFLQATRQVSLMLQTALTPERIEEKRYGTEFQT